MTPDQTEPDRYAPSKFRAFPTEKERDELRSIEHGLSSPAKSKAPPTQLDE